MYVLSSFMHFNVIFKEQIICYFADYVYLPIFIQSISVLATIWYAYLLTSQNDVSVAIFMSNTEFCLRVFFLIESFKTI